jgi:Virulence factor BrkB/Phage integrase, N-terminal SAM-like domain
MTKPMSTLRRHMIEDMKMRNMSPNSQKVYAYAVANFATFHGKSPDKLGPEHVREYRLRLIGRGLKATSINPIIGALRFFYGTTLRRKEMIEYIPYARREDTLPAVLTPDEVVRLFKAVPTRLPAAGLAGDQRHPVRAQQLHQRGAAIWRADSAYTELRHLLRSDLGSVRRDLQSAADVKLYWADVLVGAMVTALLFNVGKFLIGLYLSHSAVASSYGAAGALIIVMLWIYYSAQIFLLGAPGALPALRQHSGYPQGNAPRLK